MNYHQTLMHFIFELANLVIELIRNFKDDLLNAAVTEQYKKVKSI